MVQLAYYCMDNPEHQMFKGNIDGVRCPQCKGLVNIKPISTEQYNELPTYDSLRKQTNKGSKGIKVKLLFDDNQILKLRAIARHAEALADELDAIDKTCKDCSGPITTRQAIEGGESVGTYHECERCRSGEYIPTE